MYKKKETIPLTNGGGSTQALPVQIGEYLDYNLIGYLVIQVWTDLGSAGFFIILAAFLWEELVETFRKKWKPG